MKLRADEIFFEKIYNTYNRKEYLTSDPIQFPLRYRKHKDREIAALLSALFAYGNVKAMFSFLEKLFIFLSPSPFKLLSSLSSIPLILNYEFKPYRFQTPDDVRYLLIALIRMINSTANKAAPLFEPFFDRVDLSLDCRIDAFQSKLLSYVPLTSQTAGLRFLIGTGKSPNSLRKRYCMFLRWMVRDTFPDMGLYAAFTKSDLVVPMDTHIFKFAKSVGWVTTKGAGWRTALEVTRQLKMIDSNDPLRFDFPLTRPGILRQTF